MTKRLATSELLDVLLIGAPADRVTWDEINLTDFAAADAVAPLQMHSPAASQFIGIDPTKIEGFNMLKVRSGTSGAPVNQGATRNLTLVVRGIL